MRSRKRGTRKGERAGVTGCVLARNEASALPYVLEALSWCARVIVIDNASTDETARIAREAGALVINAPETRYPDALRNLALPHVETEWVFFLDADERLPPELRAEIQRVVAEGDDTFDGMAFPMRHHFLGAWIPWCNWSPGYSRPQLLRVGRFEYGELPHQGVVLQDPSRMRWSPADRPELVVEHLSYPDLPDYIEKLNRYTSWDAERLLADRQSHRWEAMLADFTQEWCSYYETWQGSRAGMRGFILAFHAAFYRFVVRAKAWDLRRKAGQFDPAEPVPGDLRTMLDFMATIVQTDDVEAFLGDRVSGDTDLPGHPKCSADKTTPKPSYPTARGRFGCNVTGCILARNEEAKIEEALQSLWWVDQLILIDNESSDRTVEIARRYGALILNAPRAANFDGLRNLAVPHATGNWIYFLDADERVPVALAEQIVRLVKEQGDQFEALSIPFRNWFCGKPMEHSGWWPSYTRPQLLKKGRFRYNERLHSGVNVDGRRAQLPPEPELAIAHYSYDDLEHYLTKLNRYTTGEAESMLADGHAHCWQAMLAHFVHDWQVYYERNRANLDGMHGFILSFLSAFYRFLARAKLWDLRRQRGEIDENEPVPRDLREMLEFMAQVAQEGAEPWLSLRHSAASDLNHKVCPANGADTNVPLLWKGPLFDPSGYADEGRGFVLGLAALEAKFAICPDRWGGAEAGLGETELAALASRVVNPDSAADVCIVHTLPALQQPYSGARVSVARCMFETDRLPEPFVRNLNRMDRVLVPSEFNRETFVRSGVDPDRIGVVPGAIDATPFAAEVEPWPLPGTERFRFLSVFDWTLHKGWDVLLEAFAREFAGQDVCLVVKTWSSNHYTLEDIRAQADALLRERVGRGLDDFPNIHLWEERLPADAMPRLYRAADAFVLPTRGEGWCRPLMESMAAGLPTIATAWSGLTAFHSARVGYPLKFRLVPVSEPGAREIPIYAGHYWADPDRDDLQRLLRRTVERPEEARKRGQAAQQLVRRGYSQAAVARLLLKEIEIAREADPVAGPHARQSAHVPALQTPSSVPLTSGPAHAQAPAAPLGSRPSGTPLAAVPRQERRTWLPRPNPVVRPAVPPIDFRRSLGRPLRIRWEGDQALLSSLALVNREFCIGLLAAGDVELTLADTPDPWHRLTSADDPRFGELFAQRGATLSGPPDVVIRHHFPPQWERPEAGKLVVIQPWEYGHLPNDWVMGARDFADEVWAYSRWVRDIYARSGVPAEKVQVVPLGFNPASLCPEGPQLELPTRKRTRFLFVGGAIDRKGADLLLETYLHTFRHSDDVCLVVKDMGTRTFYQGATFGERFRAAQADRWAPEILYFEDDLPEAALAALYRSCACLVQPYRGEGFALSPLEAMACGLPVIVTGGGPTDDFVDDTTGYRLPSRRVDRGTNRIGEFEAVGDLWQLEPDPEFLAAALRGIHERPEEARALGLRAADAAHAGWTWEHAVAVARQRLLEVVHPTGARPFVPAHPWPEAPEPPATPPVADSAELPNFKGVVRPVSSEPVAIEPGDGSLAVDAAGPRPRVDLHGVPPAASGLSGRPPHSKGTGRPPATAGRQPDAAFPKRGRGTSRPLLSLAMIVRDEETRIGECLRSIAPYVDEMVVVDTGSVDRTPEIAAECGARVYRMPWPDSFAAARNESLRHCRGEWVFWMDADDVITAECGARLRQLVRDRPRKDAAFQVQVRIPAAPGEFSDSVVDHVKLFPNRPDLRFEHRIHEQILPSIRVAKLEVLFSDIYVTHKNYDRSPEGQAKKRARDFRLLRLDLLDRPDHPFTLFNLGMTHLYATKEYELVAHYLRRSLERSRPSDSIVRKAYAMWATARICQQEWEEAIRINEQGRQFYPDDAELLFQAGQVYQELGNFTEGRMALERLVEGGEDEHYRSVDTGLRGHRGRHELALLYRRMGDARHCARVLEAISAEVPGYLPAQFDLVETLFLLGRQPEAYRLLQCIPEVKGSEEVLQRLRALPWSPHAVTSPASARERSFRFRGESYAYFIHSYNSTATNERSVEISLALTAVRRSRCSVLEIGNVLSHYGVNSHTVVDKYEQAPGVLNQDVADYRPHGKFDLIVSVSTLEHVGWDQDGEEPGKLEEVLRRAREEWLAPGGRMLITVPLGYNPHLDQVVRERRTGTAVHYLRRINADNEWREIPPSEVGSPRYGHPFPQANVLAVLTIEP